LGGEQSLHRVDLGARDFGRAVDLAKEDRLGADDSTSCFALGGASPRRFVQRLTVDIVTAWPRVEAAASADCVTKLRRVRSRAFIDLVLRHFVESRNIAPRRAYTHIAGEVMTAMPEARSHP